jgi:hypothetical protein
MRRLCDLPGGGAICEGDDGRRWLVMPLPDNVIVLPDAKDWTPAPTAPRLTLVQSDGKDGTAR